MKTSLIITTYNWKEALKRSLQSAFNQTCLPDEIIVAEDGLNDDTKQLIEAMSREAPCRVIHSRQEDKGFRAARSRNKAVALSTGDYIIFVDGDIILGTMFIQDHLENAKKGYFIQGSRVLVGKELTRKILEMEYYKLNFFTRDISNRKNAIHSDILSSIFSREKTTLSVVKTCNLSFFKDAFIKINGFDNDFEGWGCEDDECANRLLNSGVKMNHLKFKVIAYHLYHEENSKEALEQNRERLRHSIEKKLIRCENGIDSFIS